jgi:hypothetical protein
MDTAAVLGDAMTEYVLVAGAAGRASAADAPAYIVAWLEANGYRIVRVAGTGTAAGEPPASTDDRGDRPSEGSGGANVVTRLQRVR